MFQRFRQGRQQARAQATLAESIYATCVAASRHPDHYTRAQVADTVDGRYDVLVAHVFAAIHGLSGERTGERGDNGTTGLVKRLIAMFIRDMDQSLREMGAGDVGVAKRVRLMANGLNGRLHAYAKAFDQGGEALADCVNRNVYRREDPAGAPNDAARLFARYLAAQVAHVAAHCGDDAARGGDSSIQFRDVTAVYDDVPAG